MGIPRSRSIPKTSGTAGFVGKSATLPIIGRSIPVIADEAVELEFGTGALKVTPGHDPTDYEIGERHNLDTVSILDLDGTLNETCRSILRTHG